MATKKIKTPDDMPQVMSRVGVIRGGLTYELPEDIADDLVKTRKCKPVGGKTPKTSTPAERTEKR